MDLIFLNNASYQLLNYDENWMSKKTTIQCIKFQIKLLLDHLTGRYKYTVSWRTGILAKALSVFLKDNNSSDITASINKYFERFTIKKGVVCRLDTLMNAEAALIFSNDDLNYNPIINDSICFIDKYRKDKEGSLPFFEKGNDILVDGLMICPFLFRYSNIVHNKIYYDQGLRQILNFISNGFDDCSIFPYHGYNIDKNYTLGVPGWGRGTGWFLTSIVDSLPYIEESCNDRSKIVNRFAIVLKEALKYQRKDGLFSWYLPSNKSVVDTSATSMIIYSLIRAINMSLLDKETYLPCISKALKGLDLYIKEGKLFHAMGDCKGISMYPQDEYNQYPWSNGFYILMVSELSKILNKL